MTKYNPKDEFYCIYCKEFFDGLYHYDDHLQTVHKRDIQGNVYR